MQEEKPHLTINSLINHLQSFKANDVEQASSNLSTFIGMNLTETSNVPECIQYTRGIGYFGSLISKNDIKTAILFDSTEAFDFADELRQEESQKNFNLLMIEDPLPVKELSFPLCPNGKGWKTVILDDIVPFVGGDEQLTKLMRSISSSMELGGYLIVKVPGLQVQSWNKEFNNTVVTESFAKKTIRKFERTITSHGEIDVRFNETANDFSASDLHACARNAHMKPNRDIGLDSSVWCCYQKVN